VAAYSGGGIEGITMGTFGGARAKGGPVSSGQTYMVGERGPELFVPGRSGTIVANDKMGGGNTNVVVNVDAKGSSVEGDEQGANQLGRVISAAVQSELIKQQRPGGILAR
jgi:phage-related minor tail protein